LMIGYWTNMEFKVTDVGDTAFTTDTTWIRVIQEVDIAVRQPTAFCTVTGVEHLT